MNLTQDIADAIKENPSYELMVSGDIAHKLEEDNMGVRVFSSDVADYIVDDGRREITIIMGVADLNYKLSQLLDDAVKYTVDFVVAEHSNEKGGINSTYRFKQKLKKELLSNISKRLNQ